MAEINPPTLLIIALFAATSLAFQIYHVSKVDGCRCLIPRRKDWFRCLLIYMLLLANVCLIVWAGGWAYVRYELGWVRLGPAGARPWPSALFPARFKSYNVPLSILYGITYALLAALNAEEGLFWAHLMRAVRRPRETQPFLKSNYFKIWIAISVALATIQQAVPWTTGHNISLRTQLAVELLVAGTLEMFVLAASYVVVAKFPAFLAEVKASGAGPEVQARLYHYHELNKIRTLARFTFSAPMVILGIDGLTKESKIHMVPIAVDIMATIVGASVCFVISISILLYLPRVAPSSAQHKVMIGQQPSLHNKHGTSGFALMSLLREGGQWMALTRISLSRRRKERVKMRRHSPMPKPGQPAGLLLARGSFTGVEGLLRPCWRTSLLPSLSAPRHNHNGLSKSISRSNAQCTRTKEGREERRRSAAEKQREEGRLTLYIS